MSTPIYTPAEAHARETFLSLMWAFSYPSRMYTLPVGEAFLSIGQTLLDLETSYFTPDHSLGSQLAFTGARLLAPERAAYHFYPEVTNASLDFIRQASLGTMLYPDTSATLIMSCQFGKGTLATLTGPGIKNSAELLVDGIPTEFWQLRAQAHFPMGWDIYLVDGQRLVGLPRSTKMAFA